MSRVVNAVIVGLAAFVLVAGVVWYVGVVSQEDKVRADVRWRVEGVEGNTTWVVVDVLFSNRLDAELTLREVEVEYRVGDVSIAGNRTQAEARLGPRGSLTVPVRLAVPSDVVPEWLKHHVLSDEKSTAVLSGRGLFLLGGEEVEVPIKATSVSRTSLFDSLEDQSTCPGPGSQPCLESVEASWGEEGGKAFLAARLTVRNSGEDAVALNMSSVRLRFGETTVAKAEAGAATVEAGASTRIEVRLFLEPEALGEWWAGHVGRCEKSGVLVEVEIPYEAKPENRTTPTPSNTTTTPSNTMTTPSNTTSPPPTNSTSPSPTTTSASTTDHGYAFARAEPGEPGMVAWNLALDAFETRLVCGVGD